MFKQKNKKHKKFYGFTLVELIIVITILAILSTISFVSFSGYTSKSRDSNRLFSLKEISKALEIQKEMTSKYPQPDYIYAKGGIPTLDNELFSVGLIGKNVSNYVKLGSIPLDPKTSNEYLYGLTRDNKNFQIAGTLENLQSSMIIPVTYADNGMQAVVEGNYKGVIKFSTGSSNYIGNVPSLIFSRTGTYTELRTFVINKGKNLPYSVDGESLGTGLGETEVLKELHNKDSLTLTGVIITNPKSEDEIKKISDTLGVPDVIIADSLGNKEYASSGGSSGGEGTPILNCGKNETMSYDNFVINKNNILSNINNYIGCEIINSTTYGVKLIVAGVTQDSELNNYVLLTGEQDESFGTIITWFYRYADTWGDGDITAKSNFDGKSNSEVIYNQSLTEENGEFAAKTCWTKKSDNLGLWYLPSINELQTLYDNLKNNGIWLTDDKFPYNGYRSSTRSDKYNYSGMIFHYEDGTSFTDGVGGSTSNKVRCVTRY